MCRIHAMDDVKDALEVQRGMNKLAKDNERAHVHLSDISNHRLEVQLLGPLEQHLCSMDGWIKRGVCRRCDCWPSTHCPMAR